MALPSNPFPIDEPVMPEARQIGREGAILGLKGKLEAPAHQWMIGERRIGKTSAAKAVLARLRADGAVALDVDLSKGQLETPEQLAGELARQAQAAGVGEAREKVRRAIGRARKQQGRVKGLGRGLHGLGYENQGEALDAVAALLAAADDGAPGLDRVLESLAVHARATERRVVLLLDEVHLLARIETAEATVARWCREEETPIVCTFAGSEESAARALREVGQPLAAIGEEFALPAIGPDDWIPGLRTRFGDLGIEIGAELLDSILAASQGHPRRTMLIASRVREQAKAANGMVVERVLVELAIREAEEDRSWR